LLPHRDSTKASRRTGLWLAVSGLLLILVMTLYPVPSQAIASASTPLLCLVCGREGGQDVVLNLLLFFPFAVGLRLLGWPWIHVVGTSGLLSFSVESLQFLAIPGRDASLSDLLTNTTGGALGAAVAPFLRESVEPAPRNARLLLLGGAVVWLGVQGLSAWMLAPWTPGGKLRSGWAHLSAVGYEPFRGRVHSVRLDGIPMPANAPVPDSAAVRARLNRGSATLELEATSGSPGPNRRWLYVIHTASSFPLRIDQWGRDVYFTAPARALEFRLVPPTLRVPDGFPMEVDQAVHLSAGERDRRLWVTSTYGRTRRSFELNLSPSHGWILLFPFGFVLGPEARALTVIWLAATLVPLGFWAGRTGWGWLGWVPITAALALGLGVLPWVSSYPPVHWSEWLAGVLGGAGGWALHRLASYLQTRCDSPSSSEFSSS
jgi:hypothetical protein